jgi:hypothetical protein
MEPDSITAISDFEKIQDWVSRASLIAYVFPSLQLENFDFDNLITTLINGDDLDLIRESLYRIENNEPEYDFEDRQFIVDGVLYFMNTYFFDQDLELDADILQTIMIIAELYPQLNPQPPPPPLQAQVAGRRKIKAKTRKTKTRKTKTRKSRRRTNNKSKKNKK